MSSLRKLLYFTAFFCWSSVAYSQINLDLTNINAVPGTSFCVDFEVPEEFTVFTMQFTIDFDPQVLQFDQVTGFNLPSLSVSNFGTANAANGVLTFSWFNFSATPVTIAAGTTIFQLCFTVIGNAGDGTTITLGDDPTPIEITQSLFGGNVGLNQSGGEVTVGGPTVVQLFIENEFVKENESTCLDISASFFNNIDSLAATITWNPNIVQLDSATNFLLTDLDVTDFDLSDIANGVLVLNWGTSLPDGITLGSNATLFSLCFTAIGDLGDFTSVSFSDNPVETAAFSATNSVVEITPFNGSIRISTPLNIFAPYQLEETGSSFCVPIRVSDFVLIQAMQFTIQWDTAVLMFDTINSFNLQWLDVTSFGYSDIDNGILTLSWFDFDFSGETLADSSTIFNICFKAVGEPGDVSPINFIDEPTVIEVIDLGNNSIGLSSTPGEIELQSVIRIVDTLINGVDCANPMAGGIDITPFGGETPYTFLWSNGDTTEDISNVFNGFFDVTITDASTPANIVEFTFFIPGNFSTPFANAGTDTTINCDVIPFQLSGTASANGPYTYLWTSNDGKIESQETTLTPLISFPGTYTLIVTDTSNGCGAVDDVLIGGVLNFPVADAGPKQFITCINNQVVLDGSNSDQGNAFTYEWITTNGQLVQDVNTLSPLVDTIGTYTLIVTDTTNGCSATDNTTVEYNLLTAEADAGDPVFLTCQDTASILEGTASGGFAFTPEWYTLDGNICGGAGSLQPCVNEVGTYCLVVSNNENGCNDTSCVDVAYDTIPPISESGPLQILNCLTNEAELDGSASSTGNNFAYLWIPQQGGVVESGQNTLTPTVSATGTYILRVTNLNTGCKAIDTTFVVPDPSIPNAIAGKDTVLTCADNTIKLNGLQSNSGTNYAITWTTFDGSILSGANTLTPLVNLGGSYTLSITQIFSGCNAKDTVQVSYDTIPPVANAGTDREITCVNPSPVLNGSASSQGANITYKWTTTDGEFLSTASDTTKFTTVKAVGTYTLTVTNEKTGCTASDEVQVTFSEDLPEVNVSPDTILTCSNDTILLSGLGSEQGDNISYFWSSPNPGGIVSSPENIDVLVVSSGTYTLAVVDTNSCFAEASIFVAIDTLAPAIDNLIADGMLDCTQDEVTLLPTITVTTDVDYQWITTNGAISSGQDMLPNPTVTAPGDYTLILTNTENGCTSTSATEVMADTVAPDVSIDLPIAEIDCKTPVLSIDGSASSSGIDYSTQWTTSNGNILTNPTDLVVDINGAGTYYLTITNTSNGCVASDSAIVAIDTVAPSIVISQPTTITCVLTTAELNASASSTGANYQYNWTILTSGNITGPSNQLITTVDAGGSYQLQITDNANGCTSTGSVTVPADTLTPTAEAGTDEDLGCEPEAINLNGQGSSTGINFGYQWTTTQGTILAGANTITPLIDGAGTYILLVTNNQNGCTQSDEVLITQSIQLEIPDAGMDEIFCDGETINLSASPTDSAQGVWTSPTGATFDNPQTPTALVTGGVVPGENILIWTLSTTECPNFSSDTVVYVVEQAPQANDDGILVDFGESDYRINVLTNDILTGIANWTLNIINQPTLGSVQNLGNGDLSYSAPSGYVGPITFTYEVCNENDYCPDLCAQALVTIIIDERPIINPDSIVNLPNTITPNGDGLNDQLIFDFIELNPEQFDKTEMTIFNRWGEVIFEAQPYQNNWDGTTADGKKLPEGTYYYIMRLNVPDGNIFRGSVTVLR